MKQLGKRWFFTATNSMNTCNLKTALARGGDWKAPLVTQDGAETMGFALVASLHPKAIRTAIGSVWEVMVGACSACC